MKINEVAVKRDIGVNYDQPQAVAELRELYGDIDMEILEKVFKQSMEEQKAVESVVRKLKTTSALKSRTNQTAANQLLQLMINIRKSEISALSEIRRERRVR